jgi:phosphinothricin acetyltransferase
MKKTNQKIIIKVAEQKDWQRIIEIYNEAVLETGKTADTEIQSIESRLCWLTEHLCEKTPILLAKNKDKIIGWCSISSYRSGRKAVGSTAEISYYLDKEYRGSGNGKELVVQTIKYARRKGIKNLIAILLDINDISIKVLEKLGFEKWGHLPGIAEIDGKTCGQYIYGRNIEKFQ